MPVPAKIRLRQGALTHKFATVWLGNDFSLYIAIEIPPIPGTQTISNVANKDDLASSSTAAPRRLSYHTTGRVNYHGLIALKPRYFEPLFDVTTPNVLMAIAVTDFGRLVPADDMPPNSAMLDFADRPEATIGFTVVPAGHVWTDGGAWARMDFEHFGLVIHELMLRNAVPAQSGVRLFANDTRFSGQRHSQAEAELAYVQKRVGPELIIRGPNGTGVYTLYPAVIMRIAPRTTFEFKNPGYRTRFCSSCEGRAAMFAKQT